MKLRRLNTQALRKAAALIGDIKPMQRSKAIEGDVIKTRF